VGSGAERYKYTVFCALLDHHEESYGAGAGRSARKTGVAQDRCAAALHGLHMMRNRQRMIAAIGFAIGAELSASSTPRLATAADVTRGSPSRNYDRR